jgi:glyoxylase-like metal-dependent hydrolase (beta-lactamase superfamily II)
VNPRVSVGEVEVVSLTDAEGTFTAFRSVFPGATDEHEAFARESWPELFDGDAWVLPFRCFLVRLPDALVLVDAGVARQEHFLAGAQARLLDTLQEEGVAPADVDVVLLTHLHVDHVGWTIDDGRPVFERARHLACRDDVDYFLHERADSPTVVGKVAPLAALPSFATFPLEEHELLPGVSVVPAPGHTPGHVAFAVESRGSRLVLLGDTAVHPLQLVDLDLVYTAEVDPQLAARTRRRLIADVERTGGLVAAGHFPGSPFGRPAIVAGRRVLVPPAGADASDPG